MANNRTLTDSSADIYPELEHLTVHDALGQDT